MDTCLLDPCAQRAATSLVPRLRATAPEVRNVWRGDEWNPAATTADCTPTGFANLDQELPGKGWPRGQLVELLVEYAGIGELGLLLPALAALAPTGRSSVWVLPCKGGAPSQNAGHSGDCADPEAAARQALPYAPALAEAGLNLAQHIFVKPLTPRESGWALEQSLRTAHLGALVGWLPDTTGADADFRELRRLHLLAQRHNALVFIIRTVRHARSPSPAALRLRLHNENGQLQVQILKRRGRPLLEPIALQVHPARWNSSPASVTRHAPGTPVTAKAALDNAVHAGQTRGIDLGLQEQAKPAVAQTARRKTPLLRSLLRVFAPQNNWTMPAALSPAPSS